MKYHCAGTCDHAPPFSSQSLIFFHYFRNYPAVDLKQVKDIHIGLGGRFSKSGTDVFNKKEVGDYLSPYKNGLYNELICGWLQKQGGANGGSKGWAKRWCVVIGMSLYYFTSPQDLTPKGFVDLRNSVASNDGGDASFSISYQDQSVPTRVFRCESKGDAERWLSALKTLLKTDRSRSNTMSKVQFSAKLTPISPKFLVFWLEMNQQGKGKLALPQNAPSFMCGAPRQIETWYLGLTNVLFKGKSDQDAAASLKKKVDADPNDNLAWAMLGSKLEAIGDVSGASSAYLKSIQLCTNYVLPHFNLGKILSSQGKMQEALVQFEFAAALTDRDEFSILIELGKAYLSLQQVKPAMFTFEHCTIMNPKSAAALMYYGIALSRNGNSEGAIKQLKAAYVLDSKNALLLTELSSALAAQAEKEHDKDRASGKTSSSAVQLEEEALATLKNAIVEIGKSPSVPANFGATFNLAALHEKAGLILQKLGRHGDAVTEFEVVLSSLPTDPRVLLLVASSYLELASSLESETINYKDVLSNGHLQRLSSSDSAGTSDAVKMMSEVPMTSSESPIADSFEDTILKTLLRSEELVAEVLTIDAASIPGNLLCGKVFERLGVIERLILKSMLPATTSSNGASSSETIIEEAKEEEEEEGEEGGEEAPAAAPVSSEAVASTAEAPATETDVSNMKATSGWTPKERFDQAKTYYVYAAGSGAGFELVEANVRLGNLLKNLGELEDAKAALEKAVAKGKDAPTSPALTALLKESNDLLARTKRLIAGEPEFPVVAKKRDGAKSLKKDESIEFAAPTGDDDIHSSLAGLSAEEKEAAFFAAMKEKKQKEKEEAEQREKAKVAAMNPEERAEYEKELENKRKHEQKKEKALKSGLGAFSSGGAAKAILAGRGRGRGKK
jgi:tetratricopeptide (TPR) repeat protein